MDENKENKAPEQKNDDAVTRKVIFALCYIWGILFFLPLIMYKDDEAQMHANEGLVLLILSIVGNAVFGILTVFGGAIGTLFGILAGVFSLLMLVLGIIGIVYVVTDRKEPLPLIGQIKLLK